MTSERSGRNIDSLQAGRAIAAFLVVLHHAGLSARAFGGDSPVWRFTDFGYIGVDFFFVLSGFIIYHATAEKEPPPMVYAKARIARIYIPYLPAGLAMAAFYSVFPHVSAGEHQWSWLAAVSLFPVNQPPALSVAWTLQHEIWFYALFGVLWFGRVLRAGLVLWATLIVASAVAGWPKTVPLAVINLEFLMGIAAAVLYRRGLQWGGWLPAAAVLVILWFKLGGERDHSVLVGLAMACVILSAVTRERAHGLHVPRWLVDLGAASYALYLIHDPLISVAARLTAAFGGAVVFVSATVLSLAGGIAYYRLYEKPALAFIRSRAWAAGRVRGMN